MNLRRAKTVCFEGGDCKGKLTQAKRLLTHLRESGHKAVYVEIPWKSGVTYPLIYKMLENGSAQSHKHLFQIVQFFNKFFFQVTRLNALKKNNDFVIFDRWSLSSAVYGAVTGVNRYLTASMYSLLEEPDSTVVLCGKSYNREDMDTYEKDQDLQRNVDGMYRMINVNNKLVVQIDGKSEEQISNEILKGLEMKGVL